MMGWQAQSSKLKAQSSQLTAHSSQLQQAALRVFWTAEFARHHRIIATAAVLSLVKHCPVHLARQASLHVVRDAERSRVHITIRVVHNRVILHQIDCVQILLEGLRCRPSVSRPPRWPGGRNLNLPQALTIAYLCTALHVRHIHR